MNDPVRHAQVMFTCDHCESILKRPIGQLLTCKLVTCTCGHEITVTEERLQHEVAQARKRFAALHRTVREVGRD